MQATQEQKDRHIVQWQASRLSQAAYCRHVDLPYHRFRSWMRHAAGGSAVASLDPCGFIEVPPHRTLSAISNAPISAVSAPVSIVLPSGISLQVQMGIDPVWFGRLIAGLQPC